jgi:polyhydroxyalkanoate synthesis repressor PhaR
VTLEDLATMVKRGEDFVVSDAKTGDDITRPVLAQIIFEQEGKDGQSLLPISFLRQLIRFYGDSMQMLVPSYLEFSIDKLTRDQQKFRDQFTSALGVAPFGEPTRAAFVAMEEQARKNMAVFRQALTMFNPFGFQTDGAATTAPGEEIEGASAKQQSDVDDLKRQLDALNKRIAKSPAGREKIARSPVPRCRTTRPGNSRRPIRAAERRFLRPRPIRRRP